MLTIAEEVTLEQVIEKSRFLCTLKKVQSEAEAQAFIKAMKKEHWDATHNCSAYIIDEAVQRSNDDGEPAGTAGAPMLGVLRAKGLQQVAAVVTRWFGGIKLGAGGLTRAYAGSASAALAAASICNFEMCAETVLSVEYADVNAAMRFLEGKEVLSKNFAERAEFVVAVRESEAEAFKARAQDFFNGKIQITFGRRYYFPFAAEE